MLTPAVKPVTAGKKIPNRIAMSAPLGMGFLCVSEGVSSAAMPYFVTRNGPAKMAMSEATIAARMKYCERIASAVLTNVIPVITRRVIVP